MAKLTISDITSGYASTTALNATFNSIEDEFNNKVLYRNNPSGEPNQMFNDIDMNNNRLLNVSSLTVNGVDILTSVKVSQTMDASDISGTQLGINLNRTQIKLTGYNHF